MGSHSLCSSHRLTIFFFIIAVYFTLKFLFLANKDLTKDNLNAELELNLFTSRDFSSSTNDLNLLTTTIDPLSKFFTNSCLSDELGVPEYVRSVGCSGVDFFCDDLTCSSLLRGNDKDLYILARDFMQRHPRVISTDASYLNLTTNCDDFKRSRKYQVTPSPPEFANFPIAFSILVHKGAEQTERLLRSIYRPHNIYCIHVDGKAAKVFQDAMQAIAGCFDNVFVASQPTKIIYGGFTRLQADVICMRDLLNHDAVQWRYLINLAAQSFPLQTVEEMVQILKIYNGSNDIEGIHGRRILRFRFEREWSENIDTGTVNKTGRSYGKPPHDLDIVRGSAYGIFSRGFIQFVLTDPIAIDLLEWSKNTYSPDEHYWATLHHTYSNPQIHAPGSYSGNPNDKPWLAVYVKWGTVSYCHGQFIRGVCVLGVQDLPDLISRKEFFVNKFYDHYQPLALDCLDAWIQHKQKCPVPFDADYYRSLPFIKNH